MKTINRHYLSYDENKELTLYEEDIEIPDSGPGIPGPDPGKKHEDHVGGKIKKVKRVPKDSRSPEDIFKDMKIKNIETVTIIEVEGSCYRVYWINGFPYWYPC